MPSWGDTKYSDGRPLGENYFRRIGRASESIGQELRKAGMQCSVKEKFGSVRVSCGGENYSDELCQQAFAKVISENSDLDPGNVIDSSFTGVLDQVWAEKFDMPVFLIEVQMPFITVKGEESSYTQIYDVYRKIDGKDYNYPLKIREAFKKGKTECLMTYEDD